MQKPENKSLKEYIVTEVSKELQFTEDEVDSVIGWSYKKANEAVKANNEVEISGLGKLMLSKRKARKRLIALERMEAPVRKRNVDIADHIVDMIGELKKKIDE